MITAELPGNEPVEVTIAVGPEGTCACSISAGGRHAASTAPDPQSFETVLKSRLAEFGVHGQDRGAGNPTQTLPPASQSSDE